MRLIARIISTVFHPILIPTIGLLIIFDTSTYVSYTMTLALKQFVLMLIVMTTLIIPLLITLMLLNKGVISSIYMEKQKERNIPYLVSLAFYFFMLYMLFKVPVPKIIYQFAIGATLSVLLAFIINLKWKISAHMIGIGGLTGALFSIAILLNANITVYIVSTLILSGLMGTSRLALSAHTPSQVYSGFFLGVICQVMIFI